MNDASHVALHEAIEGAWIAVHATWHPCLPCPFPIIPPRTNPPSRARPCKQLISFNLAPKIAAGAMAGGRRAPALPRGSLSFVRMGCDGAIVLRRTASAFLEQYVWQAPNKVVPPSRWSRTTQMSICACAPWSSGAAPARRRRDSHSGHQRDGPKERLSAPVRMLLI